MITPGGGHLVKEIDMGESEPKIKFCRECGKLLKKVVYSKSYNGETGEEQIVYAYKCPDYRSFLGLFENSHDLLNERGKSLYCINFDGQF